VTSQDWLTSEPIAHRGSFDNKEIAENTIEAFELAIARGHPIEFDVRLTKDGQLAVFHDTSLFRMAGLDKAVEDASWDEIRQLTLLGTSQTIPTLRSVLEAVNGRVPILLEVKKESLKPGIEAEVAKALDNYRGAFAVQSFNPFSILWFKKYRPAFCRGQLAGDFRGQPGMKPLVNFILRKMYSNYISRPHFVAYDIQAGDYGFFEKMKKRLGIPLILWTADTASKQELCRKLGVNYIFEKLGGQPCAPDRSR
jgi:glycerophosphoryl diester phosphodiesterase